MRLEVEALLSYYMPYAADVLLAIEAAPMHEQRLVDDRLVVNGVGPLQTVPGDDGIGRRTWTGAQGDFSAHYRGVFDVERLHEAPLPSRATGRPQLPADVIPYIWPSRFFESDRFVSFVAREFGHLDAGESIDAMARWIRDTIHYRIGSSNEKTSAVDTFVAREGVCRDFSHVMAAFARRRGSRRGWFPPMPGSWSRRISMWSSTSGSTGAGISSTRAAWRRPRVWYGSRSAATPPTSRS